MYEWKSYDCRAREMDWLVGRQLILREVLGSSSAM